MTIFTTVITSMSFASGSHHRRAHSNTMMSSVLAAPGRMAPA